MKRTEKRVRRTAERGVALVIALFTLMLISAVATALIIMAGMTSALKANYKTSMQAFYYAKAGLEEGRSRLWGDRFLASNSVGNCVFQTGSPMLANQVCYITNPDAAAAETTMDPTNSSDPYYDTEYTSEFGSFGSVKTVPSNSPSTTPNIAGPLYKWVRITPRTEQSAGINLDGSHPGTGTSLLYYDGSQQTVVSTNNSQVFTLTALAVTPGAGLSGRRLLQYTVAPRLLGQALTPSNGSTPALNQILPAALTLDGNHVSYCPGGGCPSVNGNDGAASPPNPGVPAIAYTNNTDTPPSCSNCQSPTGVQSVQSLALPSLMQTPDGLNQLVNAITQDATAVITPPAGTVADDGSLPSGMSASNPMIVVVNGDFHLSHGHGSPPFAGTGYGVLLVTGQLNYDPDDSWNGIILVIGKGVFTNNGQHGSAGLINGAVLVANTQDRNTGKPLTTLGPASYTQNGGGRGIGYNSGAVSSVQSLTPYQVLSFREIQLTQ
jgi:Tfp pilus assembly protein PilX